MRFGEFEGDWREFRFGKGVIESAFGPRFSSDQYVDNGAVVCLRTTDMEDDGTISYDNVPEANLSVEFESHFLKLGDLVIARSGTIGITGLFEGYEKPVVPGAFLIRFRLNRNMISGHFTKAYFNSTSGRNELLRLSAGGVQKNLKGSSVKSLKFPLPTLPEQQKIATFLTAVDGRLAGLRRQLELLGAYKRGVMQRVFSGESVGEWERVTIDEVYGFFSTNSLSRAQLNYEAGDRKNIHYGDIHTKFSHHLNASRTEIPFINNEVIAKGAAYKQTVRVGDVLLADASEDVSDIGKATEVVDAGTVPLYAGLHTIHGRPKPNKIALGYSSLLLQSPQFRKQVSKIAQGAKVLGISPTSIKRIKLPLPSLPEQRRIATFLRALDDRIALVERQLAGVEAFKRGLLQGMFV
ncbi:restriction endonuclease subunit S [Neolewinella maritima]|nr:restriction endonuclease subunit S [Neolewinella maritima]